MSETQKRMSAGCPQKQDETKHTTKKGMQKKTTKSKKKNKSNKINKHKKNRKQKPPNNQQTNIKKGGEGGKGGDGHRDKDNGNQRHVREDMGWVWDRQQASATAASGGCNSALRDVGFQGRATAARSRPSAAASLYTPAAQRCAS